MLDMLMEGWSLRDIAEAQNIDVSEMERGFRNAVYAIVRQNDLRWKKVYGNLREKASQPGSKV